VQHIQGREEVGRPFKQSPPAARPGGLKGGARAAPAAPRAPPLLLPSRPLPPRRAAEKRGAGPRRTMYVVRGP
jgi:hypothetical protein